MQKKHKSNIFENIAHYTCAYTFFFVPLQRKAEQSVWQTYFLRRISVSAWQVNLENSSVPKEDKLNQSTVWCRLLLLIWDTGYSRAYLPVSEGSLFLYNLYKYYAYGKF